MRKNPGFAPSRSHPPPRIGANKPRHFKLRVRLLRKPLPYPAPLNSSSCSRPSRRNEWLLPAFRIRISRTGAANGCVHHRTRRKSGARPHRHRPREPFVATTAVVTAGLFAASRWRLLMGRTSAPRNGRPSRLPFAIIAKTLAPPLGARSVTSSAAPQPRQTFLPHHRQSESAPGFHSPILIRNQDIWGFPLPTIRVSERDDHARPWLTVGRWNPAFPSRSARRKWTGSAPPRLGNFRRTTRAVDFAWRRGQ